MLDAAIFEPPATPSVQPLPHRAIVSVAAFKGQIPALCAALGVDLPATPRRIVSSGTAWLWSGPAAWLAMSGAPDLYETLAGRAASLAAVTDQSDGRFLVSVSGPHARKILAKLVPIDLHPSVFPPDATALTLAAHIGVQLWQEEDQKFVIACFRSFGPALHHAFIEAAAEFDARG